MSLFVFAVAAPDDAAVFAVGVPDFPSKTAAAVGADDHGGERVGVGGAFACAACEFCLHGVPRGWGDDGFVVAGDVVLGYFAFVDFDGFG